MKERKLTVNLAWANVFSGILLVVVGLLTVILWHLLWGMPEWMTSAGDKEAADGATSSITNYVLTWVVIIVVFVVGTVVHELIHGITWACYAKSGWKSISFGVVWKMMAPYCHCSEPLQVRPYIIGGMMPLIVMGILPWVVGLSIGSFWTTVVGAIFIVAASGDILIVWKLRKENPSNTVLDHPTEAGCIIYEE